MLGRQKMLLSYSIFKMPPGMVRTMVLDPSRKINYITMV